jgi:hypothetical protein
MSIAVRSATSARCHTRRRTHAPFRPGDHPRKDCYLRLRPSFCILWQAVDAPRIQQWERFDLLPHLVDEIERSRQQPFVGVAITVSGLNSEDAAGR